MKIKTDFITNSSSTSFVGWGITLDFNDFLDKKEVIKKAFDVYKSEHNGRGTIEKFEEDPYDILDYLPTNIIIDWKVWDDVIYIGGKVSDLKDDETPKEFKSKILNELNNLGFNVKEIEFIEESWYDG